MLYRLTTPDGPTFPLDAETRAELADYPGEMPVSAKHWVGLL